MENKYIQIILTNGKKINCELLDSFAPLSTAAFRELVSKHYYDGTIFIVSLVTLWFKPAGIRLKIKH